MLVTERVECSGPQTNKCCFFWCFFLTESLILNSQRLVKFHQKHTQLFLYLTYFSTFPICIYIYLVQFFKLGQVIFYYISLSTFPTYNYIFINILYIYIYVYMKKIYIYIYFAQFYNSILVVVIPHTDRKHTFAVRETASLGIMGAPRVPPLNPSETIVL